MSANTINYSQVVENTFTKKNFHFTSKETQKGMMYSFAMNSKSLPSIRFRLIVDEEGDSKLCSYLTSKVEEDKKDEMLSVLNNFNDRFRFVVLNIDQDDEVCASYDFGLYGDEEAVEEIVFDAIYLVSNIIDKCAPDIMKVMWKEEENSEFIDSDSLFDE